MKPNQHTARRIKELRENSGLSQTDFCKRFSEFMKRPQVYSTMTVSCWETGRKLPPADIIMNLAYFYGVSSDYIFGLVDTPDKKYGGSKVSEENQKIEIPYNQVKEKDGCPVYVTFPQGNFQNQWGIIDVLSDNIVFRNFKIKINPHCNYFYTMPPEEITIRSQASYLLNYKDLIKQDRVYIESLSSDEFIKGRMTGWYKNSPDKEFLYNDRGFALSYEGLGIAYNAVAFYEDTKNNK